MTPVVRFFAICHSSGVDFGDAVMAAGILDRAATAYEETVGLWDAVCAGMLGEYEALQHYGVCVTSKETESSWPKPRSHATNVQLRLDQITRQLKKLQ